MTQIDNKIEATDRAYGMPSWRIWLTSMSHVPTMLKVCDMHAAYRKIMFC